MVHGGDSGAGATGAVAGAGGHRRKPHALVVAERPSQRRRCCTATDPGTGGRGSPALAPSTAKSRCHRPPTPTAGAQVPNVRHHSEVRQKSGFSSFNSIIIFISVGKVKNWSVRSKICRHFSFSA